MSLVAMKPMSSRIQTVLPLVSTSSVNGARSAIALCPYRELHRMTIEVENDAIRLGGRVSCFYFKQVAQEIVRKAVPGVRIRNELTVGD